MIYGGARGDPLRVLPVLPVSNAVTGNGGDSTADEIVAHARDLQHRHGFATHRLKAGVFPPAHEIEVYHALAAALPTGPSLGVELDHDKLAEYAEHFRRHGGYADDRDPMRPDWYSIFPERNFADPAKGAMVIKDT